VPRQLAKTLCQTQCPNGADIHNVCIIAQHDKLRLSREQAYDRAWEKLVQLNPFPATLGRICPHPCERSCNRTAKDGAVCVNATERFLGDWGTARQLPLPTVVGKDYQSVRRNRVRRRACRSRTRW
jgi:NADPH-dependent glutamate synthase beta subunit-like oxidoreductase